MTPEELLNKLRTKELEEYRKSDGLGLRHRSGNYQLLCATCTIERWDNIAESFARTIAVRLLK